ncbi:serine hydrolase domain-containing protein [Streptomyces sp. NPDC050610]|uniref:serine hydrolase domain-containing protein n=1 Tax=Streptomyces sp. NPDC050610 TaxID=3157097 RepID=UPI00343B2602
MTSHRGWGTCGTWSSDTTPPRTRRSPTPSPSPRNTFLRHEAAWREARPVTRTGPRRPITVRASRRLVSARRSPRGGQEKAPVTTDVHGTTRQPHFDAVRAALQRNLNSGEEIGVSLVVDIDGARAVDLWGGGHRDPARTLAWAENTVTNVWSVTTTVTSLAALMLVDSGDLDVHAPVARSWPEFAANGKQDVQVRYLLSHVPGVADLDGPATVADLYDTEKTTARLAWQALRWPRTPSDRAPVVSTPRRPTARAPARRTTR